MAKAKKTTKKAATSASGSGRVRGKSTRRPAVQAERMPASGLKPKAKAKATPNVKAKAKLKAKPRSKAIPRPARTPSAAAASTRAQRPKPAAPRSSYAGIGDTAVRAKTGRGWTEWFDRLDAAGAAAMDHRSIARHLAAAENIGPWWSQMVTVAYEQARGRREKHQRVDGFACSVSRTLAAPVAVLYEAWTDAPRRRRWMGTHEFSIRKALADKSLRITWIDGESSVEVQFTPRGSRKTQIVVEHAKLSGAHAVAEMKRFWGVALEALASHVAKV